MAKIFQGILGGVTGKIGNVIGSSWKGIPVLKSRPLSVANPRSAGQVEQRTKMANVVIIMQALLSEVVKPLWDRFAVKQSGANAFISANIDLFASLIPSIPADFVLSKGKMAPTTIDNAVADVSDNSVQVSWSDDSGEGFKLSSDEVFIVLLEGANGGVLGFNTSAIRSDASVEVIADKAFEVGDPIYVYLATRRADGTIVSDTAFKSVIAIA